MMPILFSGLKDERGPYIEAQAALADQWNEFALVHGLVASGSFNALCFEAKLNSTTQLGNWSINGLRQQSTISGGIPLDSPVLERTLFKVQLNAPPAIRFSIRPKSLVSRALTVIGGDVHPSEISEDLVVHCVDHAAYLRFVKDHLEELRELQIERMDLGAAQQLDIRFNRLLSSTKEIQRVYHLIATLVSVV